MILRFLRWLISLFGGEPAPKDISLEVENELWRSAFLQDEAQPERAWWEDFSQ
jgi:hypothetical protein